MGIHSLSNSNKKRNLFNSKHRVNSIKKKQKRLQSAKLRKEGSVDPKDLGLIHEFHAKKRTQGYANVTLSGKKRRKLQKVCRRNEREKLEMMEKQEEEAEAARICKVRDVEMKDVPDVAASKTDSESKSDAEMEV